MAHNFWTAVAYVESVAYGQKVFRSWRQLSKYHQKTLKVVRKTTTCNFWITDPMTIDGWAY